MRIVMISDTHGDHDTLGTLTGDVLIHCGDFENLFSREPGALDRADEWLGKQQFSLILCTGGNHDRTLEHRVRAGHEPFKNATFLSDDGVEFNGVKFWGAPWVPELHIHAFFADDIALQDAWSKVPSGTDVLITHTPPLGRLDVSSRGRVLGCEHLAGAVARCRPRIHCFGHVHASAGRQTAGGTEFINASMVNSDLKIGHNPVVLDVD